MSVLPGQLRKLLSYQAESCKTCDEPATYELIGEVDSHGYEHEFYCAVHGREEKGKVDAQDKTGSCDWCKTSEVEVIPTRDFEEGLSGAVYEVCRPCRSKQAERLE